MTIDPQEPRAEEPPVDPEEPETFEDKGEEQPPLERKDHEAVDEADRTEQEIVVEEDEEEYR
ncbi:MULTISPECIES: hypothetical protein [Streptomyces]|uniref:Nucleotide exchange factor GrpE n=1 Tax=Streptomyces evansiae TaxID=3075535 RepID=A0ABU2R5L8_9ACTN|nr:MULTISPECIES: hypothetical protein [unclassified Streptomyces]MDT0411984.1 hypothetical protein [Streptomyces sp. DSM 41979]MYQ57951.1 hypothetical protein [Streptomyces sp. SID4926]SCD33948.1 hypothetical protein GA0115251_10422 [Streptomyces sp. TverLS-915]SCD72289.1 hypothetical protein GA0115252_11616 [Streptomyces sp. DfronAA-171]